MTVHSIANEPVLSAVNPQAWKERFFQALPALPALTGFLPAPFAPS
jgi:hypothetical protein